MKHLIAVAAIFSLGAAAQEPGVSWIARPANIMGTPVKGAPYSADEITESLQVLADGTRISNQSQVTVYRDGEGRVRRESPTQITISDPVANVSYTLYPKSMTAVKSTLGWTYSFGPSTGKKLFFFSSHTTAPGSADSAATKQEAEAKASTAASLDKMQAELAASENGRMVVNGSPAGPQAEAALKETLALAAEKLSKTAAENASKNESLGQQLMQGVTADGTRTTTTIEAGAIGNDRPIQMVSERWYSSDLQTVIMTKRTDPRTGEETFRLANVHRGEPGADLFLLPPGYQLAESQTKSLMPQPVRKEE